ncbi:hypothetical protein EBT31_11220 [bacterium]|nr:hypothetical protein [bacterium]NBX49347.1 hypothetical protein [bacterium]
MEKISDILDKIKHMQHFTVSSVLPDGFRFRGKVPFDITIGDDIITATILEHTEDAAQVRLDQWIEECSEEN